MFSWQINIFYILKHGAPNDCPPTFFGFPGSRYPMDTEIEQNLSTRIIVDEIGYGED